MPSKHGSYFVESNHNQALRDTRFRPDHAGEGITQLDRDEYLSKASSIVGGDPEEQCDDAVKVKKTKWHRTAAQDWVMGCDHQLQCCTGHGLQFFMPLQFDVRPLSARPYLAIVFDKGSDGVRSVWWLLLARTSEGLHISIQCISLTETWIAGLMTRALKPP